MNVAMHTRNFGEEPALISRVGDDPLGRELIEYVQKRGLSTQWIQIDPQHPTGTVEVNVSNSHEVTYDIVESVAWDFIAYDDATAAIVQNADIFVFGSLVARHQTSRETLLRYLASARLKVLDVNLRPPYYTLDRITQLLEKADIAKMNHHELAEVAQFLAKKNHLEEKEAMALLRQRFGLKLLIVTRGERGAAVLSEDAYVEQDGFPIRVEDTIGSGDSFLATFLSYYLHQKPLAESLKQACLVGAFVATQKGATPEYDPATVASLLHANQLIKPIS